MSSLSYNDAANLYKHRAAWIMVVDDSYALKIGVDECRAKKLKTAFLQIGGDIIGKLISCQPFSVEMSLVDHRLPFSKGPDVTVKAAELLLNIDEVLRMLLSFSWT